MDLSAVHFLLACPSIFQKTYTCKFGRKHILKIAGPHLEDGFNDWSGLCRDSKDVKNIIPLPAEIDKIVNIYKFKIDGYKIKFKLTLYFEVLGLQLTSPY
ncbi:hypothetical protein ACTFIY_004523 [Dictyostelium cf. discoideum]